MIRSETRARGRARALIATLAAASLMVAACGDVDNPEDANAEGGPAADLTVMVPFPSAISFHPLFVAHERGYLGDVNINVESSEGSAPALQQVLTDQAEVCLCSPGPALRTIQDGEDMRSTFLLYQHDVFALVTPMGSNVTSVDDLRDTVIGVDVRGGGAESWLVHLLGEQGLELDVDYTLTPVGEGATPIAAFDRDEIVAYAAAYIDISIMDLRGFETERIDLPGADAYFDTSLWMKEEFIDANPEVVEVLGRGMAMGLAWGMDPANAEELLEISGQYYPEEVSDIDFALQLLEDTNELFVLPQTANNQWGFHDHGRAETMIQGLVAQGFLDEAVNVEVFMNDMLEEYNDYEEGDL